MCVEWDWMDWVMIIMLPLDIVLVLMLMCGIVYEMMKKINNK